MISTVCDVRLFSSGGLTDQRRDGDVQLDQAAALAGWIDGPRHVRFDDKRQFLKLALAQHDFLAGQQLAARLDRQSHLPAHETRVATDLSHRT